jgi:adenine phosphoribosyltransferase
MSLEYDLDTAIRKIPDFPKKGILFYDITGILTKPEAFQYCLDQMDEIYGEDKVDAVAAIEARGFIFASPYALKHRIPLILVRKKGKLPGKTFQKKYCLEYGEEEIEMHVSDISTGQRVLVVDDLIATGGTAAATCEMIQDAGGKVVGVFGIVGLPFLNYDEALSGYEVKTLINYDSE